MAEAAEREARNAEMRRSLISFITEFAKESDRACVIVGAARLDILLHQLISAFLLPCTTTRDDLLDGDSPLGTFSARIQLAYRAGLIDAELARALNLIRRIRNEFAHESSSMSLSHASHCDRIKQLVLPLKDAWVFQHFAKWELLDPWTGPSRDFRAALALLCARLEGAVGRVKTVGTDQTTQLVNKKWLEESGPPPKKSDSAAAPTSNNSLERPD